MELTPEDILILSCVKIHPNQAELEQINYLIPKVLHWDYFIRNIIERGIAPLFYKKLESLSNKHLIPSNIQNKLKSTYYKTLSRNLLLYDSYHKIAEAFNNMNIKFVVLKGIYLSEWLYNDIALRQFADIDILVSEKEANSCLILLADMGYIPFEEDHNVNQISHFVTKQHDYFLSTNSNFEHFAPMVKNDVSIEIHIRLHPQSKKYNFIINEFLNNSIVVTINQIEVNALNFYDLILHLCVHLDKHFINDYINFTSFVDITNLLDIYTETIDWEILVERCLRYECEMTVFRYIMLINIFFKVSIPIRVVKKYKHLIVEKDKEIFIRSLKGIRIKKSSFELYFYKIIQIQSLRNKIHYLLDIIFPPKSFMIEKYKIKNHYLVLLYYPYRYYVGFKGLFLHLFGKIKKTQIKFL